MTDPGLARRLLAELIGTAGLVTVVVGSGIAAHGTGLLGRDVAPCAVARTVGATAGRSWPT